jgi:hypothetical protein
VLACDGRAGWAWTFERSGLTTSTAAINCDPTANGEQCVWAADEPKYVAAVLFDAADVIMASPFSRCAIVTVSLQ